MTISDAEPMESASIRYAAATEVESVISTMGRTEDVKFSPDYRWLAIAGFAKNRLYLYSTSVTCSDNTKVVNIERYVVIQSSCLLEPHGVSFLDNENIIVANREGLINILNIPEHIRNNSEISVIPIATIKSTRKVSVESPGSIHVLEIDNGIYRVLACNNYLHTVTSHKVNLLKRARTENEGVLIRRGLSIPDGICISPDREWVAVSSHATGTVLLYKSEPELNEETKPCGMLHGIVCPHAIRFSKDGELLFVADSASPYIHIFKGANGDWSSVKKPYKSVRMLDEDAFLSCRHNHHVGGVKGIDVNHADNMLATTCAQIQLAFYDLDVVMGLTPLQIDDEIREKSIQREYELI